MCDCATADANGETTDEDARPPRRELSFEDLGCWFIYIGASIVLVTLIRYIYKNSDKISDKLSGGSGFLSNLGALSLNGVKSLGSIRNLVTLRSLSNFGGFGSLRGSSSIGRVTSTVDSGGIRSDSRIGSWGRPGSSTTTQSTADSNVRGWSISRPSWGRSGSPISTEMPVDSGGKGWNIPPKPSWGRSGGAAGSSAVTASTSGSVAAGGGSWSGGNWGKSSSTEGTKTESVKGVGTAGRGSSARTEITADSDGRSWTVPRPSWGRSGGATGSAAVTASASGRGAAGGGGWSTANWGKSSSAEGTKTGSVKVVGTAGRENSTTTEITADSDGRSWSIPRPSWGRSGDETGSSAVTASTSGSAAAGGGGWSTANWGKSSSTEGSKTENVKGIGTAGRGSSARTEITADSDGRSWTVPRPSWGRSGGATGSVAVTASASGSGAAGGGEWSTANWGKSSSAEGTKTGSVKGVGTAGRESSTTTKITADSDGRGWNIPRPSWGTSGGETDSSAVMGSGASGSGAAGRGGWSTEKTGSIKGTGSAGGGGWSIGSWDRLGSMEGTKTEGATRSSTSVSSQPGNSDNIGWVWGKPSITESTRTSGETGSSTKTKTPGGFSERIFSKQKPDTRSDANGSWGRISSDVRKDGAGAGAGEALAGKSSAKKSDGSEGEKMIKSMGIWKSTPLHSTPDSRIREEVDTSKSPSSWWGSTVPSGISGEAKGDKNIVHITTETKRKDDIERPEGSDRRNSNGKTGESWSWAGWNTTNRTIKPKERMNSTHETIQRKSDIDGTVMKLDVRADTDSSKNWKDKSRVTVIDRGDKVTPPDTSSRNIDVSDGNSSAVNGSDYTISKGFEKRGPYGKNSARRKDKTDSAESIGETKYRARPDVTSSILENVDESRGSERDRTGFDGKGKRSKDTTRSSGRFQTVYDKISKEISQDSERKIGSEKDEGSETLDAIDGAGVYSGSHGYGSRNGFESTNDRGGQNGYEVRDKTLVSGVYRSTVRYSRKGSAGRSGYSELTDSKNHGARHNGSRRRANNDGYGSDKGSHRFPLPSFEGIMNNSDQQPGSYRSTENTGTSSGASSTTRRTDTAKRNTGTAKRSTGASRRYSSGATWQREDIEDTSSQIPNVEIETSDLPSIEEDEEQITEKRKTDPCYGIYRRRKLPVEHTKNEKLHGTKLQFFF